MRNQVQLDVRRDNYIRIINAFNKLKQQKHICFLTQNLQQKLEYKNCQRYFLGRSVHGYYKENVGVYPKDYQSEEEFFNNLARTAIFTATREGKSYYFKPVRVKDYLDQKEIHLYG